LSLASSGLPYVFVISTVIASGYPPGLHFGAFSQKRLLRPNPTAELTLFYLRTIRRAYEKHQPHPSQSFPQNSPATAPPKYLPSHTHSHSHMSRKYTSSKNSALPTSPRLPSYPTRLWLITLLFWTPKVQSTNSKSVSSIPRTL